MKWQQYCINYNQALGRCQLGMKCSKCIFTKEEVANMYWEKVRDLHWWKNRKEIYDFAIKIFGVPKEGIKIINNKWDRW